jgi:hypothetical protein
MLSPTKEWPQDCTVGFETANLQPRSANLSPRSGDGLAHLGSLRTSRTAGRYDGTSVIGAALGTDRSQETCVLHMAIFP